MNLIESEKTRQLIKAYEEEASRVVRLWICDKMGREEAEKIFLDSKNKAVSLTGSSLDSRKDSRSDFEFACDMIYEHIKEKKVFESEAIPILASRMAISYELTGTDGNGTIRFAFAESTPDRMVKLGNGSWFYLEIKNSKEESSIIFKDSLESYIRLSRRGTPVWIYYTSPDYQGLISPQFQERLSSGEIPYAKKKSPLGWKGKKIFVIDPERASEESRFWKKGNPPDITEWPPTELI